MPPAGSHMLHRVHISWLAMKYERKIVRAAMEVARRLLFGFAHDPKKSISGEAE